MVIISYTNDKPYYKGFEELLHDDCATYGIVHCRYTEEWFHQQPFYFDHRDVADQLRVAGFCIWKPYIILDALKCDDTVCYLDATSQILFDPKLFIESIEHIHCPKTKWINKDWIKRDAFVYMNCDEPKYWNEFQLWAGSITVKKSGEWLMEEMLKWCCDRRIIDDGANECGLPNFPDFHENRSEQAIISLLSIKYPEWIDVTLEGCPFVDRTG
jgi:hypothetical protein